MAQSSTWLVCAISSSCACLSSQGETVAEIETCLRISDIYDTRGVTLLSLPVALILVSAELKSMLILPYNV